MKVYQRSSLSLCSARPSLSPHSHRATWYDGAAFVRHGVVLTPHAMLVAVPVPVLECRYRDGGTGNVQYRYQGTHRFHRKSDREMYVSPSEC